MMHNTLTFLGPVGWPELVILAACCGFPVIVTGCVLLVLYLTGVIGKRREPMQHTKDHRDHQNQKG